MTARMSDEELTKIEELARLLQVRDVDSQPFGNVLWTLCQEARRAREEEAHLWKALGEAERLSAARWEECTQSIRAEEREACAAIADGAWCGECGIAVVGISAAIDRTWARGELGATPEQLVDDYTHRIAEQQRNHFGVGSTPTVRAHCDPNCDFCQGVTAAADHIDPEVKP